MANTASKKIEQILSNKTVRIIEIVFLSVFNLVAFLAILLQGFEGRTTEDVANILISAISMLFSSIMYVYCIEDPHSRSAEFTFFSTLAFCISSLCFFSGLYWYANVYIDPLGVLNISGLVWYMFSLFFGNIVLVEYFYRITAPKKKPNVAYQFIYPAVFVMVLSVLLYSILSGRAFDLNDDIWWLLSMVPGKSVVYIILNVITVFSCISMVLSSGRRTFRVSRHIVYLSLMIVVHVLEIFTVSKVYLGGLVDYAILCFLYSDASVVRSHDLIETEHKLNEQRVAIMLSQIQPHFIFNALNTICYLCRKDSKLAETATRNFASYLRMNIDSIGKTDLIPFTKELDHVKTYLELEKLRFGDKLEIVYDIAVQNFNIPPLTLQPLVENAVKHGSGKKPGSSVIKVVTSMEGTDIVIKVIDNGIGFDVNAKPNDGKTHVGLSNVKQRVEDVCNGSLDIYSVVGTGTMISIRLPNSNGKEE